MNAITFIKQHGVEKARECIEEANAYAGFWVNAKTLELSKQIPSYNAVSIPDIQCLVESMDLEDLRDCDTSPNCKKYKERVE